MRLMLILLAIVAVLTSVSAIVCDSKEKLECFQTSTCQWTEPENRCASSLPCVLEVSAADCADNTWGCTWSDGKCSSSTRSSLTTRCSTLTTEGACAGDKTCTWRLNACVRKPTIVLSVADDLGWYDVGWNNPRARTPVLDRLRQTGVGLERHYASRFCAPSRGMLLSGRMAWRIGMQTDLNSVPSSSLRCAAARDTPLLPALLKQHGGYSTHAIGKWHLGHHSDLVMPTARGFDSFTGLYLGAVDRHTAPNQFWRRDCTCAGVFRGVCSIYSRRAKLTCASGMSMVSESGPGTARAINESAIVEESSDLFLANRAVETIEAAKVDDPLFLFIGWIAPHHPVHAPQRFLDAILNQNVTIGSDAPLSRMCRPIMRHTHLAMVSVMDEGHRQIIQALDQNGRYEDAILVFVSDNGGHAPLRSRVTRMAECRFGSNYPLRGAKYTWFEGGIRTVAFVHSARHIPMSQRGTTDHTLVSINDWKSTLLRASGYIMSDSERELDHDHWPRLSLSGSQVERELVRTELPAQVWLEQGKFVILFYFNGDLYKILQGYPWSGKGAGNVAKGVKGYAYSDIDQPWELPRAEMPWPARSGFSTVFNCTPFCLFNLSQDPQETFDRSRGKKRAVEALAYAQGLIAKYRSQGRLFKDSGFCDAGYLPSNDKFVVDPRGLHFVNACKAYLPWLDANMTYKATTSGCPSW